MPQTIVKEPKAIIMDVMGTAVKVGFIEKILIPYVKDNVKAYLDEKWSDKKLKKDVEKLRKESAKNESFGKIVAANASPEDQKKSVADYVLAAIAAKRESSAIQAFRFNLWFDGYAKGKIKTPIYSDVAIQVKKWKDLNIKIYVLSNGWKEANKKFLGATSQGDLNLLIDDHFDNSEGQLTEAETYKKIAQKIGKNIEECLFLTKSGPEGVAAKTAGMPVVLVMTHRKSIEKLTAEEKSLSKVRSFNEIEFGEPPPPQAEEAGGQGSAEGQAEGQGSAE